MKKTKPSKNQSSTAPHLTEVQVRRLPKPKKGFEPFVPRLAALVTANPTRLQAVTGVDVANMQAELAAYEKAHATAIALANQAAVAQGEALQHGANTWLAELRIYRFAKAYAADDPDMMRAIAEFEAFLKKGPRKGKGKTTPTPVAPATA